MFKKSKNKTNETVVEIVKTPKKEASLSVFQVVIFAFLFILMVWIIGFLSLELDGQKQQIRTLYNRVNNIENGGTELLESYIEKIKDLQKIDIKDQVQQFGIDIKENIQRVRELMFDKNDLAKLNGKIQALEDYNKTYRGINLLTLTSTMLLRDAINRGDSFTSELATLTAIANNSPNTASAIAQLEPFSTTGVKTFNAIKKDFDAIADNLAFIAKNPHKDNIRDRFTFKLKGLLKIRKIDYSDAEATQNAENPTSDYIIAQTQKALSEENLSSAISEYEKLKDISPDAFEYGNSWYNNAKIKLSVDEIIAPLMQYSLEKALHDSELKPTTKIIKSESKIIPPHNQTQKSTTKQKDPIFTPSIQDSDTTK